MIDRVISNNKTLKYPPIKYNLKKIPDCLIYYSNKSKSYHDFVMGKTSKPYATCSMYCEISDVFNKWKMVPSVYIHYIKSNPRKQGLGFKMLDVVKRFSEKNGCEGRFHLFATSEYTPHELPHICYRKYGMTTGDKTTDKELDKFIKSGQNATKEDFDSMLMYYFPPKQKNEKTKLTIFERIKKFLHI